MNIPESYETPFENDPEFLAKALEFFSADLFAQQTCGIEILAASPGHALLGMEIGPHLHNAKQGVQGGAIFTIADFATAIADYNPEEKNTTVDAHMQYLSGAKGSMLLAHASTSKCGRSLGFYRVDVSDELGTKVAVGNFTLMHLR